MISEVLIYLPGSEEYIRISEGDGFNLLEENEEKGYIDYIYYGICDSIEAARNYDDSDGGMILLTEYYQDKFTSIEQVIHEVLDFVYISGNIEYIIMEESEQ